MQETPVRFLGREDPLERDRLPTPVFLGFPCGSAGKESACNARDLGFNTWVGKIPWRKERLPIPVFWPGEFHGLYIVHGVPKSRTQLSAFHYTIAAHGWELSSFKSTNSKSWGEPEDKETLSGFNIEIEYDPAFILWGLYKRENYNFKKSHATQCSTKHCLQYTRLRSNHNVHP